MNDEKMLDARLEIEISNPAYDIIDEAITYTMKKYHYSAYDVVKLVMILYDEDYSFITNDNDYRNQVKLLDEYFKKAFNHSIITFVMMRKFISLKKDSRFESLMNEIAYIEKTLRSSDKSKPSDLSIFSYPLENKKYTDLLTKIEKNISMKYATAIVYDKVKIDEVKDFM